MYLIRTARKYAARLVPPQLWIFLGRFFRISFSQFAEDVWFLRFIGFGSSQSPTCVEIGAFDGVRYSNTALFETRYGARCLLVEPSPTNSARAKRNRPNSRVVAVAAGSVIGTERFAGHRAISGITKHFSEDYRRRWNVDELPHYEVTVLPLARILEEEGIDFIDFLSIDVQGGELEVLKGLGGVPVKCICIELEGEDESRDEDCRHLLRKLGFYLVGRPGISEFWLSSSEQPFSGPCFLEASDLRRFLTPFLEPWFAETLLTDS